MIYSVNTFALLVLMWFNAQGAGSQQDSSSTKVAFERLIERSVAVEQVSADSALTLAKQALRLATEIGNNELLGRAQQQVGYLYYSQNKFEQADYHLRQSLEIASKRNDILGQALALNRLGNSSQLQTSYLQALDFYLKALELNTSANCKTEIARTLVNLANVYSVIGQYQLSIEHFLKAMEIHESVGEREGLAWTSLGIARLFKRLDLLDRAMQYAESSLTYYRDIEKATGKNVGVTLSLSEIGSIYHKKGEYSKALEYAQMVLDINTRSANLYGQAANNISLGVIYLDMGNNELANKHLTRSLQIKKSIADSLDLAMLYRYLGQLESLKKSYPEAQSYFTQSLKIATKHRLLPDISEAYQSLSAIYSATGNYQKALQAHISFTAYRDSLNSSDISRLEMQYEFEKREKEQELLARQREALQEARLERQRVVIVFFVVAFILAGALAGIIFYNYREKKRINLLLIGQNNEITRQKLEIENQKEEIEQQRDFVTRQRDQIAEQQRLITDSITYASRIQNAVLPGEYILSQLPWESFVFYKPKNIVSGDFYWTSKLSNGKILIAAADCTGHGVPGAFMSMLGITLLREIAGKGKSIQPADILAKMRHMTILSLNQHVGKIDQADGMDMAVAIINPDTLEMDFAGAYLSVIIVRKGEFVVTPNEEVYRTAKLNGTNLLEVKGDKMPIGHHVLSDKPFSNQRIQLQKGDLLYLFSDGYADQFGGDRGIKFLMNNFRNLLLRVSENDLSTQKEMITDTIDRYKGDRKQVDDMMVIGLRIS